MTYPRSQLIDPENPGFYHCISRCVRRAFLCGCDRLTGLNFDHRKDWIEHRILELAKSFAVSVYAYAVMSNHLHVVLRTDPQAPLDWSDEEVAQRWLAVFPGILGKSADSQALRHATTALCGDSERMTELRRRLGSLSWFMRALNEPIARKANREDGCTGRFWEGRFKCQALLDERAILSCMAYVDLNPVRSGLAGHLEDSDHTSIRRRIRNGSEQTTTIQSRNQRHDPPLKPVAGLSADHWLGMTQSSYIRLVQWTGERVRPDKRAKLSARSNSGPIPDALGVVAKHPRQWLWQVQGTESHYFRAIGSAQALVLKAAEMGQQWLKGIANARHLHRSRQQQIV